MKKLIFSAAVLASAFFAASCQQEMLDPQAEGTTMTYTVEVPDAIATKAIGDVFTLHYEVYRQGDLSNLDADPIYEGTKEFSGVKADVQLEFVKDQEFKVLFWAQKGTPQAYDITDLREVSLGTLVANDTTAEVFAGNDHVVDCKSDKDGNVVLVRPVAQLNIATTAESFTLGTTGSTEATVVPTQSKVVVNGLYGTYNVADGTVGTKASRTYTEADVPGSDFKNTYKLMATNYLGFIPQAGDNVEVKFTIYTEKDGNIEHTVSNVPVKANYQTNIIGNLISATADYQVTLEDWADAGKDMEVLADGVVKNINGDYEISTAKGLAYAISNVFANGGTFYVLENIDMTGVSYDPADVPAGTTVHIVGETPVVTRSTGFVEITGLTKPLLKTVQNGAAASFANIYIDAPIDFVQTNNGVVAFNNCDNTATDSEDDLVGDNTNGTIAEEGTDINNLALEEALAAKASSIKLAGDITASEIIVVDYPVTIDGCGHKLTSSAGRAINVSGADGVTIKNLVIECTGERAINVINNATNVTIDNVTATAANYTVNVALSAPGAVVKIENCTLNGLNTVNVASPGAKVSVDNSTINCNDNNTTAGEAYSALCLNKAAVGAKIIATNTVVNVTDGSDSSKGRNGAEDGTVTINGSTEDVTVTIAVITYPGSDNYYGFETVASAIKFAKETDVISLIRNISVEETIVVNADKTVTIDLNGKTLNTVFADGSTTNHIYAFTNNGTLTLKNGTINTRGIFNYGTMTLESGTINAIDGNGGFGVRNYPGAEFVMNGGTIATTYEDGDVPGNGYDASPIRVDEGAKAVIKGGSINNISNYTCAIDNYGETIVDAGTFTSVHTTVANHASMTINGGSFTINNGLEGVTAHALWADAGTTTINGGTFDGKDNYNGFNVDASKGAVVNITGGKFLPVHSGSLYGEGTINVTGGEFFDNPSARVAEGYKAVQKADGKWEVVAKTYVAQDGDKKKYESLQEAFNAGGEITLLCDVTISETATLADDKTAVLDLNGKTITGTMHKSVGAVVKNNGALTIKNGTISSTAANGGSAVANNGTLIVEKATLNGAGHADGQWPSYTVNNTGVMTATETKITSYHGALASYGEGAEATLNKSEIDMAGIPGFTSHGIYTYSGGKVVVNGGTYANKATDQGASGASVINGAVEVNAGTFTGRIENYYGTPVLKGGTYSVKPNEKFLAKGYKAVQNADGKWEVVAKTYVAQIGEEKYESLQEAVAAVQDGETITLVENITFTEGANGTSNGISYTADANFTLDLNGKTVSSNLGGNALRFKIGDGNDVRNTEVIIEIKNGTIISGGNNWTAISGATADESGNWLTLNLKDLNVVNAKAGDYAIKSWKGAIINAENVTVTSSYGGSFYAVGGEMVLTNCNAVQTGLHTSPYMSMAVAVSTNGKMTVISGNYSTEPKRAEDAYNQGTSHGSWAAGVMNSGGELIINGGTFANGNYGDDALATYARGLIFGDTASKIVINGGTFNALKSIIDYQNNLGIQPNPNIMINGGNFSADPSVVTSYGGVEFAEGKGPVQGADGRWTIQ